MESVIVFMAVRNEEQYLVKTLEHDSAIDDGAESWNLLSKDGMEIAYGVYIYHVETPSGESYVDKFAVIK